MNAAKVEIGMVGEVYYRILVGNAPVFKLKLVIVG